MRRPRPLGAVGNGSRPEVSDEEVATAPPGSGRYGAPLFRQVWPGMRIVFDSDFVAAFEPEYDLAP